MGEETPNRVETEKDWTSRAAHGLARLRGDARTGSKKGWCSACCPPNRSYSMRGPDERTVGSRLRTNSFTQRSAGRASARSTSVSAITAKTKKALKNGQCRSAKASQNHEGRGVHNRQSGGKASQNYNSWLVRTVDRQNLKNDSCLRRILASRRRVQGIEMQKIARLVQN